MKVSLNWIKSYVDLPASVTLEEIVNRLTHSGLEVEQAEDRSKGFEKVFVGEILERAQHPNADRLSVCKINVGTALSPAAEVLEIVCGAQNIKAGDRIPVATLGALLPNGIEIKAAKIRNVASCGMLCSPEELKLELKEKVDGIYILPVDAPIGKNFAQYLGLDDVQLVLNVTPNRGDALSQIGVAREIAALFAVSLKLPEVNISHASSKGLVKVVNEVAEKCPIYFGRLIKGVKIAPSPDWLVQRLESVGQRSINNVVDVTSFVLWEAGQPLHAFDAAKLGAGPEIHIRLAKQGESFSSLTGKDLSLEAQDLVIAAGKAGDTAVALAGVVGGANSEVTDGTVDILLECAEFQSTVVRKTNRRLALMTDAAHRFERGIDSGHADWALHRATDLILQLAGGVVVDTAQSTDTAKALAQPKIGLRLRLTEIQKLLGKSPDSSTAVSLLRGLGFSAEVAAGEPNVLSVQVPSWRKDVRRPIDLIEEIARLWGFERLEAKLPSGGIAALSKDDGKRSSYFQVRRIRRHLTSLGFFEALNYGFTSPQELAKASLDKGEGLAPLLNPLNEDFSVLKPSLVSGVLTNIALNLAHKRKNVRLFEVRRVFARKKPQDTREEERLETEVQEHLRLCIGMSGLVGEQDWGGKVPESDFFAIKGVLNSVLELLGKSGSLQYQPSTERPYLHPYQSAELVQGKRSLGAIGRVHPRVEKNYELAQPVFVAEIDLEPLLSDARSVSRFKSYSKFPVVERDFSITVKDEVNAEKIRVLVLKVAKPLAQSLEFFDVYKGSRVPEGHTSYAFRISLASADHTLADKEISDVQEQVMKKLTEELGARFAGL